MLVTFSIDIDPWEKIAMPRYAIYYVPEHQSPLAKFGMRALGYDVESGVEVDFHEHDFYRQKDVREWTESPRIYGFHATLKAPFELAEGHSVDDLLAAAATFAAGRGPAEVGLLRVRAIGSFAALTPAGDAGPVIDLAAECVRDFELFRAPLTEADRERRLTANLTDEHRAHLDEWGYPYVFDLFRYHMTLTGRLRGRENVRKAVSALSEIYAIVSEPLVITSIVVAVQTSRTQQFRVCKRFDLGAT